MEEAQLNIEEGKGEQTSKVTPTEANVGGFNVTSFQDVLGVVEQAMLHMDKRQRVMFLQWFKKVKNKLDFTYPLGYRAVVTPVPTERPEAPKPPASSVIVAPEIPPMPSESVSSAPVNDPHFGGSPEPTVLDTI